VDSTNLTARQKAELVSAAVQRLDRTAADFSSVIDEIMPLVRDGDKAIHFIIARNKDGSWDVHYPYPADSADSLLRFRAERDPYAASFCGADFAKGSFPSVYDRILCARLRAEYNTIPYGELHEGEINALISAVEDNIGSFSQDATDYLLTFENPLRELYDLNPIPLWNRGSENSEPYLQENMEEFLERIEYQIGEWKKETATPVVLTAEHCINNSREQDLKGHVLIVKADVLSPEYRNAESQIVLCTHGNGAKLNVKGRSIFCKELVGDTSVVYYRNEIEGIADLSKLPQWAKDKLALREAQKVKSAPKKGARPPSLLGSLEDAKAQAAAHNAGLKNAPKTKRRGDMEVE
jgi:hypothetical protein